MTTTSTKNKSVKDKFITDEFDQSIDNAAREALIVARVSMLMDMPFIGNIATRLKLVNADSWCSTAATDGKHLYYNSRFVTALRPKEVIFLVGHETFHAMLDHVNRVEERRPRIWNYAIDYATNLLLVENKCGEMITTVPCLYDIKYKGMSAEEIFEELYNNAEKIDMSALDDLVLDDHSEGEEDGDGESDDDGKLSKRKRRLTEEEKQAIRDDLREAMLAAAQSVDPGSIPAGIKRLLGELTEPKMDWRQILRQEIEAQIKSDFSWMKPSRRGWDCDAVLPSMRKEPAVEATLALDMSGSIGPEEIRDFFSEVKGIVEQHASYKIGILCFDTKAYNYQEFTEEDDVMSYEPQGGGGTDFSSIFTFLVEEEIVPKQLVVFTDGETHNWGTPDYCPTTFIIKNRTTIIAPYGTTVEYT